MDITSLVNLGSAGAVIITVGLFLKFLRDERKRFDTMIGNHLHENSKLMEKVATLLEEKKE